MPDFEKAVLIYNRKAGQGNIERALTACLPPLALRLKSLLILQTKKPGDAEALCREYGARTDLLIILGGDGTVHECINGLAPLKKRPTIMILPGGTCNDFARTLGINPNISNAVLELLDGEVVPVDALKASQHYFINFWGIGLVTDTSNNIRPKEKALFGKISYLLSAFRTINQTEPFQVSLKIDGERVEAEAVMVLAANGNFIGANALPFKDIQFNDGSIDVFIVKNANLSFFKEVLTGDPSDSKEQDLSAILHFKGKEIVVETKVEMEADMDGEVYSKSPCTIKVLQHHFNMLKPVWS